jgi:hypothetical protein
LPPLAPPPPPPVDVILEKTELDPGFPKPIPPAYPVTAAPPPPTVTVYETLGVTENPLAVL